MNFIKINYLLVSIILINYIYIISSSFSLKLIKIKHSEYLNLRRFFFIFFAITLIFFTFISLFSFHLILLKLYT